MTKEEQKLLDKIFSDWLDKIFQWLLPPIKTNINKIDCSNN